MSNGERDSVSLVVDGTEVSVPPDTSLLAALREHLGVKSPKDGCSPQGQCGCCTVLVDGTPRVACVTPVRRIRGRSVVTAESLPDAGAWADAFCRTGASQCGFCTPGIVVRLSALRRRDPDADHAAVEQALLAHLCRCTGWRTILDAWDAYGDDDVEARDRDLAAASRRAELEGRAPQVVGPGVALGRASFADDTAPSEALVAVLDPQGRWTLGETTAAARGAANKVQGRRTTAGSEPPIPVPEGDWDLTLQTSWVEPGYLETDASWAEPGGEPADPLANGGAFGGKVTSPAPAAAGRLADERSRPVRALLSREDTVRLGPKRPPLAAGIRSDGTGIVRVARTAGIAAAVASALPEVTVEEVDVGGPPTSCALRGAGWAEAAVLAAVVAGPDGEPGESFTVRHPGGGTATARVDADGSVHLRVDAGDPLDEVVLRSYCVGAAHQALSWVTSESLTVDGDGEVHDLTIRSFGILRAVDTPPVHVQVAASGATPVHVSDAVFAAVAAAVWHGQGLPPSWPTGVTVRAGSRGGA
jgi:xanthine dehydrogenase small subunit